MKFDKNILDNIVKFENIIGYKFKNREMCTYKTNSI